jgi:hypothetical protein
MEAADADKDDAAPSIADGIFLLNWLFLGTEGPSEPSPEATNYTNKDCGLPPEGDHNSGCGSFAPCE